MMKMMTIIETLLSCAVLTKVGFPEQISMTPTSEGQQANRVYQPTVADTSSLPLQYTLQLVTLATQYHRQLNVAC